MSIPFIEFRGVSKQFGDNQVLKRVDLKIYQGEVTTIIGLSGSGKSVLLKHIIGLLKPDEGEVLFQGKPLGEMGRTEQEKTLSRISYMFQQNALFDSMTVYENIALPLREKTNLSKKEIYPRVMARIAQTELTDAAQRYPSELSGGMQKRVALARALVTDPMAVLFDEPTTGQDPVRKNTILSMIAQYQRKFGFTAVLVSHEIPDVFFVSNRILALYQQKIVFQGSPEEFEDFKHPFQDEVTNSLEELHKQLTGRYSKRQFILQNHSLRTRVHGAGNYTVLVYAIRKPEGTTEKGEGLPPPEPVKEIALGITDYFNNLGGFSTRLNINEFVTIMPSSQLDEVEGMFKDSIEKLLSKKELKGAVIASPYPGYLKEALILRMGLAQGSTDSDIEAVIDAARVKQKEILRLYSDSGR
jgi:phospholipid/cholesterol/gamma-HCH transport system ATP-binding protein